MLKVFDDLTRIPPAKDSRSAGLRLWQVDGESRQAMAGGAQVVRHGWLPNADPVFADERQDVVSVYDGHAVLILSGGFPTVTHA